MKLRKSRSGMALISVLLLTVMLSMLTVSMVFISTNHAGMMGNAEQQMNALKAAEGMAEYALNQLNNERTWAKNSTLDFGKAKASLYFNSATTEYLSYNNLQGEDPVIRSGSDKLAGSKVPAFTAEFICKGTCGSAVKYLKVLYLRSDIYPYPMLSDGKVIFKGGADSDLVSVKIYGDYSDPNHPGGGNIHSNWGEPGTTSIQRFDNCAIDAKGGVASAAGDVEGIADNDPNITVRKNLGSDGQLKIDEIDPNKIIGKHVSDKAVTPGTYLISPLYYIPNNEDTMKKILEHVKTDPGYTLNQEMTSYSLTKVPTPTSLTDAVTMGNVNTSGWSSTSGYSVNYNVAITTVEGVTYDAREGVIPEAELGWDKIRVASITTTRTITVRGTEEHTHGMWPFQWTSNDPTSGAGTYKEIIPVEEGSLEFKLSPNNGSYNEPPGWLINKDKGNKALLESEPLGLAKLESSEEGDITTVKFLPIRKVGKEDSTYTSGELGLSTSTTMTDGEDKKSVDVALGFTLTDDIYISGTPGSDDYKKSLNKLVENPDNPDKPNVTDNIFRIMGFTYEDKIGGKTYKLDTKLDLNNKNIYSGSHVVLGTKVYGEGSIISKGKIGYVYNGIESNEILSVSDDDLYIQTTSQGKYDVNGYLYSSDDVCIEDFDETGALAGAIKSGGEETADDMLIEGTIIGKNKRTTSDDANQNDSICITGKRNKVFVQGPSGWGRLSRLRGSDFFVKIGAWFELN